MKIVVHDVRRGEFETTGLAFSGNDEMVLREWNERVWKLLVPVEEVCFEVRLEDDGGELIEVGGLDERGYALLNEAPPSLVRQRVRFEP